MRARPIAVFVISVAMSGCEVERAPAGVTCEKLRALQLLSVVTWIRTWLRDIFDNDRHPTLFRLDRDDDAVYEGDLFTRIYCP
jgi:hypothetical protein